MHEVPVGALFGGRGDRVCAVINVAAELTLERAVQLADARHCGAGDAYTRVWRQWLSSEATSSDKYANDLDGTLAVPGRRSGSPVGRGLLVISGEVGRRAEAIGGPSVWIADPGDSEGAYLAEPWGKASAVLCDAALAFGASDLMGGEDSNILTTAWRDVIGPEPT
jgi:hypothetical protein